MSKPIEIHVRLSAQAFRRYCAFDTFRRQRRWYAPVLIAMVLITISLAGLTGVVPLSESASGALMGLGLAVPMVIFGLYAIQIEAQVARQGLKNTPPVYSLTLDEDGATIINDQKPGDAAELPWSRFWAAFRRPDAIYLYVTPDRALILPDGQATASPDALWQFLKKRLGEGKCGEVGIRD